MDSSLNRRIAVFSGSLNATTPDVDAGPFGSPGKSMVLVIDITARVGTPTVTVTIQGYDKVSGKKWTILASVGTLGAAATTILRVGPMLTAAANLVANDFIPPDFTVNINSNCTTTDVITGKITAHIQK